MSGRAARLRRLLAVRRLNEELDRNVVHEAMAFVAQAQSQLVAIGEAMAQAKLASRAALSEGRRHDWLMADAQGEAAGAGRVRLKKVLADRMRASDLAMEAFQKSRLEHEQVKRLVSDADDATRADEVRRAQAAADEWFLSKRTLEL